MTRPASVKTKAKARPRAMRTCPVCKVLASVPVSAADDAVCSSCEAQVPLW
jgi:hypothetical protein